MAKTRVKRSGIQKTERVYVFLFMLPYIFGFLLTVAYPIVSSAYYSLTKYNITSSSPEFVGLQNYIDLLKDPHVFTSLGNTLYYLVFSIPLRCAFGIFCALMLVSKRKGIGFFRTLFFIPEIVPIVASGMIWRLMYNPQYGAVNVFLKFFGINGPMWLTDENWTKPAIILMYVWCVGKPVLTYMAAIQSIPSQYYEAARVDGAGMRHRVFGITLPLITPIIFFNVVTDLIFSFQIFAPSYIMQKNPAGPSNSTLFYAVYMYRNAFEYLKMGYASAMAWILFVIILVITLIQFKVSDKWVNYN